jgi:hypothetical protein
MDKNNVQFSIWQKKDPKKTQKLTSDHNALISVFRLNILLAYFWDYYNYLFQKV